MANEYTVKFYPSSLGSSPMSIEVPKIFKISLLSHEDARMILVDAVSKFSQNIGLTVQYVDWNIKVDDDDKYVTIMIGTGKKFTALLTEKD